MVSKWRAGVFALVLGCGVSLGVAGLASPDPGRRTPQEIAALSADEIVAAVKQNVSAVAVITAEAHRRNPSVPLIEGVALPPVDPATDARMRAASPEKLLAAIQAIDAENDAMIARYKVLRPEDRPRDEAPVSTSPKLAPAPKPAPVTAKPEASTCKALYGKAYMLCGREDRSCKMIAASDWQTCEKTGRWP